MTDKSNRRSCGKNAELRTRSASVTNPFTAIRRTQYPLIISPRLRISGFTLAELLVSIGVLVLLVLLATQLLNSAAAITILGQKRMDADSEARQVLDRMAIDFAQMVKRVDVDYYLKFFPGQQQQNDQIAFYSAVPGYYSSSSAQSPVSLVAYRVNSNPTSPSYNKLERLGRGLVWAGIPTADPTSVVFLPLQISALWPYATNQDPDPRTPPAYEVIGPDVFRFEYYYLLKTGALLESPCTGQNCALNGWRDVAAIAVDIAVIDPRSKVLLNDQQIATFNGNSPSSNFLTDFHSDLNRPGQLLDRWQSRLGIILRTRSLPPQPVSGIRLYERFFYLNQ